MLAVANCCLMCYPAVRISARLYLPGSFSNKISIATCGHLAHGRIMSDRVALDQLLDVVRQNTEAMTKLAAMLQFHPNT